MRKAIVLFAALVLAAAPVLAATCVQPADFTPHLSVGAISFPDSLSSADGYSPTISLRLEPSSGVTDVKLKSVSVVGTARGMSVRTVATKTGQDVYSIQPVFDLSPAFDLASISNLRLTFQGEVSYASGGQTYDRTYCFGDVTANVAGSISSFVGQAESAISGLSNASSVFDVISALIKTTEVVDRSQCSQAVDRYDHANATFTRDCLPYRKAIEKIVDQPTTTPAEACALYPASARAACLANLTSGPTCLKLYPTLLDLERNASDVCYRNSCPPVYNLTTHAAGYKDPLFGHSLCQGTNLSNVSCRDEFERVEGPRCPSANVTKLAEASTQKPATLSLSTIAAKVCREPSGGVTVLKDPKANVVNAVSCMCLPAIDSYVSEVKGLYDFASQCILGSNASNCSASSYASLCDLGVGAALQCGGLGYGEFSATAQVYAKPDGSILNFDPTDIAQTSQAIATGGVKVIQATGKVSVDIGQLTNAICRTALGDQNIDWSQILNYQTSSAHVQTTIGTLCAPGVKLTSPCVCDLSAVGQAQTCGATGLKNECVYDVAHRKATCEQYAPPPAGSSPQGPTGPSRPSSDLLRYATSLPTGEYGPAQGIASCTAESSGVVVVTDREGSFVGEATLTSGFIALPEAQGQAGAIADRVFSCANGLLRVQITPENV